MDNKRYYWIKLKTEFFNQDTIDFLLSQTNGCEYVVLYQMLCLRTANNNGVLSTNVGEIIVPYDIGKIARDTKYFNEDTIRVALELYKQLGLIYEGDNSILQIAGFDEMIGSESKWAKYKRDQRTLDNVQSKSNKRIEIEYRDKSIDIDIKENKKRKKPTIEEIEDYCKERNNNINPQRFFDYYETNGWVQGKNKPIKDWKACVRTWERQSNNPDWFNKEIKKEEITDEELKELNSLLEEFK